MGSVVVLDGSWSLTCCVFDWSQLSGQRCCDEVLHTAIGKGWIHVWKGGVSRWDVFWSPRPLKGNTRRWVFLSRVAFFLLSQPFWFVKIFDYYFMIYPIKVAMHFKFCSRQITMHRDVCICHLLVNRSGSNRRHDLMVEWFAFYADVQSGNLDSPIIGIQWGSPL
jgi:hypothetical protein